MTKLYVANTTRFNREFHCRVPERKQPLVTKIPMGTQVLIGDFPPSHVDDILKDHAKYGMVRDDEIDRTKPFIGVAYSLDKPVRQSRLVIAMEHNNEVLEKRGVETRKNAAVAINTALERSIKDRQTTVDQSEVTVIEEDRTRQGGRTPKFAEGYRVSRTATGGGNRPRSRRRAA